MTRTSSLPLTWRMRARALFITYEMRGPHTIAEQSSQEHGPDTHARVSLECARGIAQGWAADLVHFHSGFALLRFADCHEHFLSEATTDD